MANAAAICNSFRVQLLCGSHAFGTQATNSVRTTTTKDTFNIALYTTSGSYGAATDRYLVTNEVSSSGYSAGGALVTNATEPTNTTVVAYWTPSAQVSWSGVTFTTDCALLYNNKSTVGGAGMAVATFALGTIGVGQSPSAGTFTLTMPTNDASTGLIRIS